MKYLLPLLAVLFVVLGCCATTPSSTPPASSCTPTQCPLGEHGSFSYGATADINWLCSLQELSDNLAWIKCDFTNMTNNPNKWVCVNVEYVENSTDVWVVRSRDTCSGLISPKGTFVAYAAFGGNERTLLSAICKDKLENCHMTTTVDLNH
jgi:hypothetical protein